MNIVGDSLACVIIDHQLKNIEGVVRLDEGTPDADGVIQLDELGPKEQAKQPEVTV